ncbi:hypothetical protein JCM10908_006967 [Rhodotorula pacifica]|uniref:uncharacterized protein n=1 Tax=Rhodotorula pacifica TaxID=1495444 RepID=UPI00316F292F
MTVSTVHKVDPVPTDEEEIRKVLVEARRLAIELEPLYEWDDLCEIIQNCRLAELDRHPTLETLYAGTFNPLLKRHYGTTEAYLRLQLGWPAQEAKTEKQDEEEYWTRAGTTNVRRNDWPYAIPKDVQHWVVWVPLPLFHPLLCKPAPSTSSASSSVAPSGTVTPSGPSRTNPLAVIGETRSASTFPEAGQQPPSHSLANRLAASSKTPRGVTKTLPVEDASAIAPTKGTWDWVSRNGLGGLTGAAAERFRARYGEGIGAVRDEEDVARAAEGDGYREEEGPEREIRAFVEKRWRVEEGWETAWFANPPGLQSVPGLAHFHVLARKSVSR